MARMTEHQQQRGRIIGIGGVFFKSADHERLRDWYAENLGIVHGKDGAGFKWRTVSDPSPANASPGKPESHDDTANEYLTAWSIFPDASTYFDPSRAPFMINYIVDDLDAMLAKLARNGVRIDPKREDYDYGRFASIYDPDGNKIELWEPYRPE